MNFDKLTTHEKQFYFAKIESVIASKKLFLKFNFSLPELVQETDMQLHLISHLINLEIKHHFNDYINLMRIEYFKEMINCTEWNDFQLEKMMLASGFKSRTTFHRAFIRHLGVTPSEYIKSNRMTIEHRETSHINS